MKKVVITICLIFCLGGCTNKELQTLALGIHGYQLKQEIVVKRLVDGDELTEEEKREVVANAEALSRATGVLSELLGNHR